MLNTHNHVEVKFKSPDFYVVTVLLQLGLLFYFAKRSHKESVIIPAITLAFINLICIVALLRVLKMTYRITNSSKFRGSRPKTQSWRTFEKLKFRQDWFPLAVTAVN